MVGKTLERSGKPTPVFFLGESCGQKSSGRSPWGHSDSDATKQQEWYSRGCTLVGGWLGMADIDRDTLAAVAGWPPQSGVPGGFHGLCPHDTKTAGYELRKKSVKESFPS